MRQLVGLAACLLLAAAVVAADKDKEKKSEKSEYPLDGVWKVTSLVFNGSEIDDAKGSKFTFKGPKLSRETPDGMETYSFKLDPSKKPGEVDFVPDQGDNKGKTLKGIYWQEKGELKLCLSLSPDAKRPKEFASKDGEELALVVLKQDKS
jgi:uncharacterized protein (TIGR03067 family)